MTQDTERDKGFSEEVMSKYGSGEIRLGTNIGDRLCGTYDLTNLDHKAKTTLIYELSELLQLTMRLGWHEHTGDWDWRVTVDAGIEGQGGLSGTWDDDPEDLDDISPWADTFGLVIPDGVELDANVTRRSHGEIWTLCNDADNISEMWIEEYWDEEDGLGTTKTVKIPVDEVKAITIWYDT